MLQPYRIGGSGAGAFNVPIPAGVPTDGISARAVRQMTASMGRVRVDLMNDDNVPGVYVAGRQTPVYTIRVNGHRFRFPIPHRTTPGGHAASGSDAPVDVLAPSRSSFGAYKELRLWRASINHRARTVSASGFGIFAYDRRSDGRPLRGSGTGSGLPWVGLIRAADVRSGAIRHALRLVAPDLARGFRAPATKSDGHGAGPLKEGMRLQLDPGVNCARRTVPGGSRKATRLLRMICVALQRYGIIVIDSSGSHNAYGVQMELDKRVGGTADWRGLAGAPPNGYWGNVIRDRNANRTGDRTRRTALTGIPWSRMRVLSRSVFPR
jgi:hypothetical protein